MSRILAEKCRRNGRTTPCSANALSELDSDFRMRGATLPGFGGELSTSRGVPLAALLMCYQLKSTNEGQYRGQLNTAPLPHPIRARPCLPPFSHGMRDQHPTHESTSRAFELLCTRDSHEIRSSGNRTTRATNKLSPSPPSPSPP